MTLLEATSAFGFQRMMITFFSKVLPTPSPYHHTTPQPFYGPFSGTTRVSRCQKITSGLYDAKED